MTDVSLATAVTVDAVLVLAVTLVLVLRQNLRHSHPLVIYLAFHVLAITARGFAVANGAPTFLAGTGLQAPTDSEIAAAITLADAALIAAVLGWLSVPPPANQPGLRSASNPLRPGIFLGVAALCLPLGLLSLFTYGYVPGASGATAASTAYAAIPATWPGLVLLSLVYVYGFRWFLIAPLGLYLSLIALQGFGRFRLIIPVLLLGQIYLDRRDRRWPGLPLVAAAVVLVAIFLPLKDVGRAVQQGEGLSAAPAAIQQSFSDALSGRESDQVILDQLALTLSLGDESGKVFAGRPYLNVLVLPVPRALWAGKPGLADHLGEISRPSRPLDRVGGITTLPGDLYLNFRWPGVILLMFLFARISGRFFIRAYENDYSSVIRLAYLLLACNFIQIFRDGPISIVLFVLVQMFPLVAILALHRFLRPGSSERPRGLGAIPGHDGTCRARWLLSPPARPGVRRHTTGRLPSAQSPLCP